MMKPWRICNVCFAFEVRVGNLASNRAQEPVVLHASFSEAATGMI